MLKQHDTVVVIGVLIVVDGANASVRIILLLRNFIIMSNSSNKRARDLRHLIILMLLDIRLVASLVMHIPVHICCILFEENTRNTCRVEMLCDGSGFAPDASKHRSINGIFVLRVRISCLTVSKVLPVTGTAE